MDWKSTSTKKTYAFLVILICATISFVAFGLTHSEGWNDPLSENQPLAGDSRHYNLLAENMMLRGIYSLDGHVFSNYREPGYPFFLVSVYKVFGLYNFWAVRIIQLFMLALLGYFVYLIFLTGGSPKVGLVAGVTAVLLPYMGYYSVEFMTELMYALLVIASIYFLISIIQAKEPKITWFVGLGAVLGYATITRAQLQFLPLIIFVLLILKFWKEGKSLEVKKVTLGLACLAIIVGSWMSYSYFQSSHFSISSGRQGQVLYIRAARAELSYTQLAEYTYEWLKRSATGGRSSEFLNRYEFKKLQDEYIEKISVPSNAKHVDAESRGIILSNLDKYIAGNFVEFIKLTFIEHTYAGNYNKYMRAGFYVLLYSSFVFGLVRFLILRQQEYRTVFWLALGYLAYHFVILTSIDALPRYNTPLMPLYLLVAFAGMAPLIQQFFIASFRHKEE